MTKILKICKVHGNLPVEEIYANKKGWKFCKICNRERSKKYRKTNPEKVAFFNKKWREKNPDYRKLKYANKKDHINEVQRRYYANNKERYRELRIINPNKKLSDKRNTKNLSDCYVRKLIIQRSLLTKEDVCPEWIELKRTIVKIKRIGRNKDENRKY